MGVNSLEERFWKKVDKRGPNECWLWTASKDRWGYGVFTEKRKKKWISAHRLSWRLHTGKPAPTNLCVLHRCDKPACVNPSHLFLGTQSDNVADMMAKGRCRSGTRTPSGEKHRWAKLTVKEVNLLLALHRCGVFSMRAMEGTMGISRQHARSIISGKSWLKAEGVVR